MKKVLFILCLLVSSLSYGQIRYNQMPDLDSLAGGDFVPVFRPPYDQGKATFSTLIDFIRDSVSAGNAVDSIWRVSGKDSIFFRKSGTTYKIKDSTGGGGSVNWGGIGGTIEDQADLLGALDGKLNKADTTAMLSPYLRSNVAAATYATIAALGAKADTTLRPEMYVRHLAADTSTGSTSAVGTGLLFPIAANEVWQVTITGTVSKATTTTGLKLAIGAPTGATIKGIQQQGQASLSTAMQNSILSSINSLGSTFSTGAGVEVTFRQEFVIANGSNAGNVELQFATVTSNPATVYKFTKLTAIRNKN